LGEGTVAFVAACCGPNLIRLIVFFQKTKLLQKMNFLSVSYPSIPTVLYACEHLTFDGLAILCYLSNPVIKVTISLNVLVLIIWSQSVLDFGLKGELQLADSIREIEKKLNSSAKLSGLPPANGNKADAALKPINLLDELESKLDDLFALDDKDAKQVEKRQIIKSPLADVKDAPKAIAPDKDKVNKTKTEAPAPPAAAVKKGAVAPTPQAAALASTGFKTTGVQKQKEIALPVKKAQSAPIVKGATLGEKTEAPAVEKSKPASETATDTKPAMAPIYIPATLATKKPDQIKQKGLKTEKRKPLKPEPFEPVHTDEIVEPKKEPGITKLTMADSADKLITKDDLPDKIQKREQRPANAAVGKKPADKSAAGTDQKKEPSISKTKSAPIPQKVSLAKGSQAQAPAKPVESKKETEKTNLRQDPKKYGALKFALGGIVLVGGVLALLIFFLSPDPPRQVQSIAAPMAHKIIKPPAKAPETKPAPPAVQTMPQRPKPAVSQPEVPPAAAPADEKKPAPPTAPAINAADEIQAFLQEWKTAWEKSAGAKGDTDAFMSFYSDDFTSDGLDKNRWRQDKAEKNRKKEWIRIKLDKIKIVGSLENGRYEAGFTQIYQSSNHTDTSNQILILKKEASDWKIIGTKPQTSYPYSIHDGSYRTVPPTREAVEAYRQMGLEAYWARVDLGEKGTWYRVFIGYFNNRESAERIIKAKKLKDVSPQETKYENLIGVYASKDDLQRQRRFITEKGFCPYVIRDDAGNFNLYVGAYDSLKDAEKFSAELSARGIPSQVVER